MILILYEFWQLKIGLPIYSSIFINNVLWTPARLYRILLFHGANIPFDRLPLRIANFDRHSLPVLSRSSSNSGYFTIDVYCPTNNSNEGKITLKGNLYRKWVVRCQCTKQSKKITVTVTDCKKYSRRDLCAPVNALTTSTMQCLLFYHHLPSARAPSYKKKHKIEMRRQFVKKFSGDADNINHGNLPEWKYFILQLLSFVLRWRVCTWLSSFLFIVRTFGYT